MTGAIAIEPPAPSPMLNEETMRVLKRFAPAVLSLALLVVALFVLHVELGQLNASTLAQEIARLSWTTIAAAVVLTVVSYVFLAVNEAFGLHFAGKPLPFSRAAFVSFISYAFAHNLGLNLLTGGSIRYRMYATNGLNASDVANVTLYGSIAFGIGSLTLAGIALIGEPESVLARLNADPLLVHLAGIAILAGIAAYFIAAATARKSVSLWGWTLTMPGPRYAAAQIVVGAADMLVSAAIVFILMPTDIGMGFAAFAAIYTIATWAGLLSHVPGGAGVFEAVMVVLLPGVPKEQLIAALLAYRVVYYVLPLIAAAASLAAAEFVENRAHIDRITAAVEGRIAPILAPVLGLLVFFGGVVLLLSGATPALEYRMSVLKAVLPLPLIELSHLAGSLSGVALLILARGLFRRLDGAYFISLGVLMLGIAVSLLKGLDFEEAIVLAVILGLLLVSRSAFYRRSSLLAEQISAGWIASVAAALAASTWIGFFAYRDVTYARDLWFNFSFDGDAQRFLRASLVVAVAIVAFALLRLLRPRAPEANAPLPADIERAYAIASQADDTLAQLVTTGDKSILFSPSGKSFLMYDIQGRSWITLSGPFGDPGEARDLAWRFRELCDQHGARPVFYQIAATDLPLCLDLGLSIVKLGEEAQVPLTVFTLEGRRNKDLRLARNRAVRDGLTFEIIPRERVADHMDELKAVSDIWLSGHRSAEKGFSLGFFCPAYLARNACAVVRRDGRIIAFANLLESAHREELSVDLMRHAGASAHGVMDYLFADLMLWGAAQGYRRFNLGLAPLSGLEDRPLAPLWHRAGSMIFRRGEAFYNFEGLRQFKEKFHPEWRPRYLASPGGLALPSVLLDVTALVSGGLKEIVYK